mgnify:FL=1
MENANLVYEMAERLETVIEVYKNDVYQGKYKVIDGKVYKLKENEELNNNSKEEEVR